MKQIYKILLLAVAILALPSLILAQEKKSTTKQTFTAPDSSKITYELNESSIIINRMNPKKPIIAGWLSTALPGAGQVYNGKAWKVPIIYAAFATTTYLTIEYNNRYSQYKQLYKDLSESTDEDVSDNDLERAEEGMKYYTRYRDINVLLTFLFYVLNIVDASVDAHLSTFDVGDNLAHSWQPTILPTDRQYAVGLKYTIRF